MMHDLEHATSAAKGAFAKLVPQSPSLRCGSDENGGISLEFETGPVLFRINIDSEGITEATIFEGVELLHRAVLLEAK